MTGNSKAKIFLADERGVEQYDSFRSYLTFNFGNFLNEYKVPFGDLYVLNDESIAGGHSIDIMVHEPSTIILIPVAGAVSYKDNKGNESLINSGEAQIVLLTSGSEFVLLNPYETEPVNYLQVRVKSSLSEISSGPLLFDFNLVEEKNKLVEVFDNPGYSLKLSMGQFMGREEALYSLKNNDNYLFIFVVEGAFEVQGRLLHARDGLALWEMQELLELEALSNEAIILLLEFL